MFPFKYWRRLSDKSMYSTMDSNNHKNKIGKIKKNIKDPTDCKITKQNCLLYIYIERPGSLVGSVLDY